MAVIFLQGIKRSCAACASRFYDLGKTPATCPMCGTVYAEPLPKKPRAKRVRNFA